jgi:drug/metabolite transporter (DMT)-like permease
MLNLPAQIIGVFSSLAAAASWGAGDFAGGIAVRRNHAFTVLAIASSTGMAILLLMALLTGEGSLSRSDAVWAAGAGIFGGIGLVALFKGLALGNAAVVSPIAGVVGAIVPIVVGAFLEGLPSPWQIAGFALGITGIWMVTRSHKDAEGVYSQNEKKDSRALTLQLALAFSAGIGFGLFFVLIAQVSPQAVFTPLAVSKATQATGGVALVLALRIPTTEKAGVRPALMSGVLDVVANTFFLMATKLTRLDVATVLSSMYPVGTVLLSQLVLKEHITTSQWLGVALSVCAIALIIL